MIYFEFEILTYTLIFKFILNQQNEGIEADTNLRLSSIWSSYQGVNFTNILFVSFLYESPLRSFSLI